MSVTRAGSLAGRESWHLQHGGQNPLVAAEGEEVVEMHGAVDDGGRVLPEQGAVLGVQDQGPVEHVEEEHDLIPPGELAGHAQEHLFQELDPQALLKRVQAKQLLPSCEDRKADTESAPRRPCWCRRVIHPEGTAGPHVFQLWDVAICRRRASQHSAAGIRVPRPGSQRALSILSLMQRCGQTGEAFAAGCC